MRVYCHYCSFNLVDDVFHVIEYLFIGETDNSVAFLLKVLGSLCILYNLFRFLMILPVNLDD